MRGSYACALLAAADPPHRAAPMAAVAIRPGSVPAGSAKSSNGGKRLKRTPRVEEDGVPLGDEILLQVFAGHSLETDDLVRCAATCRRWCRLVSGEAEFICRLRRRPSSDRYYFRFRPLAVGFFHRSHDDDETGAPPRFIPFDSFSRRAPIYSNSAAVLGGDLFKNCRLIASRNGRLVLELRRASRGAALRLAVFHPVTGDVSILPTLSGKDMPGSSACALLSAAADVPADPPRPASSTAFRLLIVYKPAGMGTQGPGIRRQDRRRAPGQDAKMDAGVPARGAVFWLHGATVFSLRVDTLAAAVETLFPLRKRSSELCRCLCNRRLAVSPSRRTGGSARCRSAEAAGTNFVISIFRRDDESATKRTWAKPQDVELNRFLPWWNMRRVCIRAVCEKSGLVFFATGANVYGQPDARLRDLALYVLDLETKEAMREVPAPEGGCFVRKSSWSLYGYEMDLVSYT
ncbi:LOW QUALITY PROTEIN: hypothetical protein SETIT_6G213400v2 [Setaria italica]|uniref:F-box domain-containing protein n=1 Tax=Setaria italica TaxID=4555 RepID=A0A368RNZ9_SETIT|nr:LOW QUALITY PROTEIN: hypothetical protein SETIT_6G213400v2 [Setaria italica]